MTVARPKGFEAQSCHFWHSRKRARRRGNLVARPMFALFMPTRTDSKLRLRRKSRTPDWQSLLYRVLFALGLIGIAVGVHWFDRDGLRDNVDGHISFLDVLYFTMITITTVGFGDITPVTPAARAFDTFVVTPIRIFVWIIFLGTAYDFMFKRVWNKWRMSMIQKTLSDHIVIAGFGRSGESAMHELSARGVPSEQIVVVEVSETRLDEARECGTTVLLGDATRDQVMKAVQIDRAKTLIVAVGRDDTAVLVTLTARRMAPKLAISAVILSPDNEALAHQAGADTVINPTSLAGLLLAGSTAGAHLADYVGDLVTHGGAALAERPVQAEEIGRPLSAIETGLGVRIYRGGAAFCFSDPQASALEAGDQIIEVLPDTR